MAVTPEKTTIDPPCLVNPTVDCHLPCLNLPYCEAIFTRAIENFGTTASEQRETARAEGISVENRRLLLPALRQKGILQRCIGINNS